MTWHLAVGALAILLGGLVLVVDLYLGDGLTPAAVAAASSFTTAAVAIVHRGSGDGRR